MTTARKKSQRSQKHKAMLKEALSRPGVYEVMQIHSNWEQQKKIYDDAYSFLTKPYGTVTTTNHSNLLKPD